MGWVTGKKWVAAPLRAGNYDLSDHPGAEWDSARATSLRLVRVLTSWLVGGDSSASPNPLQPQRVPLSGMEKGI